MKKCVFSAVFALLLAMLLSQPHLSARAAALFDIRISAPASGQAGWEYYNLMSNGGLNPFPVNTHGGNCTWYAYGRVYEVTGEEPYYLRTYGDANGWYNGAAKHYSRGSTPKPGAIACWSNGFYGHVAFVERVNSDGTITMTDSNWDTKYPRWSIQYNINPKNYMSGFQGYIYFGDFSETEEHGSRMASGKPRELPDGDYMIASAGDLACYLDISGGDMPAEEGANVQLWSLIDSTMIGDGDAWTIKYNKYDGDGFYTITQYKQPRALDVSGASTAIKANIQVWQEWTESAAPQQWAISKNWVQDGPGKGYRLEARCSGYSADVQNAVFDRGTNVLMYKENASDAQKWLFIPYKPSQTLAKGRYILLSAKDDSYELDVAGDTGDVENGANVQLWSDTTASRYNAFDVIPVADGYYKLIHAASGKALDVSGASLESEANIQLWDDNGTLAQLWAITPQNNGFMIRSRCGGYAMDLADGKLVNGQNVRQLFYNGSSAQTWKFVRAECAVTYNANGGTGAPSSQTKYYKTNLNLASTKPTRAGYAFMGWATSATATTASYQPGASYTQDADLTLYAVWKANYTVTYDANGGVNAPASQTKTHGVDLKLSSDKPTREGYSFIYWSASPTDYVSSRNPGDIYKDNADLKLYAMWKKDGTEMSNGAGKCLLEGDYTIWVALDKTLALDIEGTNLPSEDGMNVCISTSAGNAYDAWTLTYLNNGFYAIKQYRTNMALTVADGSTKYRANVQVNTYTGSTAQQWSIEKTDYGYRLKARCSGFSADIVGGVTNIRHGRNVHQWSDNEGDNQSWIFVPFKPAEGLVADFKLPGGLKAIGAEAFMDGAFQYALLPEGVTSIGARAFGDCSKLRYVYIPVGCTSIASDAFEGVPEGLTLFGADGSYAEFYAGKHGYAFIAK